MEFDYGDEDEDEDEESVPVSLSVGGMTGTAPVSSGHPSAPRSKILIKSRSLYLSNLPPTYSTAEVFSQIFGCFGVVELLVLTRSSNSVFLKCISRVEAENVHQGISKLDGEFSQCQCQWACGFGPSEKFDFVSGTSLLTPSDWESLGEIWRGEQVVEEPDRFHHINATHDIDVWRSQQRDDGGGEVKRKLLGEHESNAPTRVRH